MTVTITHFFKGHDFFDIPGGLLDDGQKLSNLLENYLTKYLNYPVTYINEPEFASYLVNFEVGHSPVSFFFFACAFF